MAGDSADYVDVAIVQFAAHCAYLDTETGTGYLVVPSVTRDVPPPRDPLVEAAWFGDIENAGTSLHTADRRHALRELEEAGWELLCSENGTVEIAGTTVEGGCALCLFGPSRQEHPSLADLARSIVALDVAAGISVRLNRTAGVPADWW